MVCACGNGTAGAFAPEALRRIGAEVIGMDTELDYTFPKYNPNPEDMEMLHAIRDAVLTHKADVGLGFDGDGDRVLAVDRDGQLVDGDELLMLVALHLLEQDRLPGNGIAVTVMTNFAIVAALGQAGIKVASTAVGDRYVLEALRERGWALGGEQSGHIIELGFAPSGDGIASALLVLEALGGGDLSQRRRIEKLPQRLVNVRVRGRGALGEAAIVQAAIASETQALAGRGRVLVRPSGTEPLIRVMVEAPSGEEAEAVCGRLVAVVESELG